MAEKTKEIKDSTVRGLEPDIQRLVGKQREEARPPRQAGPDPAPTSPRPRPELAWASVTPSPRADLVPISRRQVRRLEQQLRDESRREVGAERARAQREMQRLQARASRPPRPLPR